ncbi:VPEID-CTERM sorting domain-containing protein [Rubellimicrobium arenae]|uniref:VPEID-CTERM sorting domain-containing protein n=1 Tax=Rubellimicrobium arenae TaxID=2817372 RepID=UPI001B317BE8|nr:VPEID-CTERM sorting domain-containing protein [Rubellimicrobium arenae]
MIRTRLALAVASLAAAAPAYAHHRPWHAGGPPRAVVVPEIDASAGLLAIGALATVVLFMWERQRRKG